MKPVKSVKKKMGLYNIGVYIDFLPLARDYVTDSINDIERAVRRPIYVFLYRRIRDDIKTIKTS